MLLVLWVKSNKEGEAAMTRKPEKYLKQSVRLRYTRTIPRLFQGSLKKRWSHFVKKVYETDPLFCPKCQGEMRTISLIDQPDAIQKILGHLGL